MISPFSHLHKHPLPQSTTPHDALFKQFLGHPETLAEELRGKIRIISDLSELTQHDTGGVKLATKPGVPATL